MAGLCWRAVAAALFVASPLLAASDLRIGPLFLDHPPQLEVALDGGAEPPKTQDLSLAEDGLAMGHPSEVRPFAATGRGMAIAVAVDVSGSMAGRPLAQLRRALARLVREVAPGDRVALLSFADDLKVEAAFGASGAEIDGAISRLRPRGHTTELFHALFEACSLFDRPGLPVFHRLLVISDGKDEGRAYRLDDVVARAAARGLQVDSLGLTRVDPSYLSNLQRLADLSGGRYRRVRDSAGLEEAVHEGLSQLQETPVALFPAALRADGQPHTAVVRWQRGASVLEREARLPVLRPEAAAVAPGGGAGADGAGLSPRPHSAATDRVQPWTMGAAAVLLIAAAVALLLWRRRSHRRAAVSSLAVPPGLPLARSRSAPPLPGPPPGEAAHAPPLGAKPASRRATLIRHEFAAPSPGHPSAVLLGEEGASSGQRVPIQSAPFWIGAGDGNDLRLAGDDYLSERHAFIQFHEGSLLLFDNESTNGTFVNLERLAAVPRPLSPGDQIRVGHSTFRLQAP
jgi:Mg-chelatase subunit ChlD